MRQVDWDALRGKVRLSHKQVADIRDALGNLKRMINLTVRQDIPSLEAKIAVLKASVKRETLNQTTLKQAIEDIKTKLADELFNHVVCFEFNGVSFRSPIIEDRVNSLNETLKELNSSSVAMLSDERSLSSLVSLLSEKKLKLSTYRSDYVRLETEYQRRLLVCENVSREHRITEDVSLGQDTYLSLVTTVYHVRAATITIEYRNFLYAKSEKRWYKIGSRGLRDLTKEQAYRLTEIINTLRNDSSSY